MDGVLTALVGIAAVFIGYLLSLWRNRVSPWVALLSFWETQSMGDMVVMSEAKKLQDATMKSWMVDDLERERYSIADISDTCLQAQSMLEASKRSEEVLESGIEQLRSASTANVDNVRQAIISLLIDEGVSTTLEMALVAGEIEPAYDLDAKQLLRCYDEPEVAGGCFCFSYGRRRIYFGSDFGNDPDREASLRPMAELISRLQKDELLAVFEKLRPLWRVQRDLCNDVLAEAKPIVDSRSRWACTLAITNYGATPFIIFPEFTMLYIRARGVETFELPCEMARQSSDQQEMSRVTGVVFIKPGTAEDFGIVTRTVQQDIRNGHILRTIWDKGGGEAFVKMRVRTSDMPWSRWVKSSSIGFGAPS